MFLSVTNVGVAVGQAELLMKERFTQFSHLIDDCELKRGEKEVTCQDLQGFWDIVYIQVHCEALYDCTSGMNIFFHLLIFFHFEVCCFPFHVYNCEA